MIDGNTRSTGQRQLNKDYLDIIVSSSEIKKLIKARAEALGLDLFKVAKEAGVSYRAFKKQYLQQDQPMSSPQLRQEHIIKILQVLGVLVKITVVETPLDKMSETYISSIRDKYYIDHGSK